MNVKQLESELKKKYDARLLSAVSEVRKENESIVSDFLRISDDYPEVNVRWNNEHVEMIVPESVLQVITDDDMLILRKFCKTVSERMRA